MIVSVLHQKLDVGAEFSTGTQRMLGGCLMALGLH